MSDLSWLNPTPHAIAVYASRPLSPVAAQHSLPSGRYSLLGPDFHRLDRTSLRLAHSFNHLVGEREQPVRQVEAERLCSRDIDHQLELCRQHNRQITRLLAFEDASGMNAGLAICFGNASSVAHQAAADRANCQDGWNRRQSGDRAARRSGSRSSRRWPRTLPVLTYSIDDAAEGNRTCTCPAIRSANAGALPR